METPFNAPSNPPIQAKRIPSGMPPVLPVNPPPFEDVTLYRIQLRLTTGRGNDAGTDSGASVQMNDKDLKYYLSKGIDNFEEGHTDTYDVLSTNIKQVKDIKYIRLCNRGEDGIAFKKVELLLNNNPSPVFVIEYPGRGMSTDNNQPFTIPYSVLRSSSNWAYTPQHKNLEKAPKLISKEMIVSMVECSIGNQITESDKFGWGTTSGINTRWGPVVEVSRVNSRTLHFDLDLQRYLGGPNPEVDVDFDLVFTCENGRIKTELHNLKYGTNWIGQVQAAFRKALAKMIGKGVAFIIDSNTGGSGAGTVAGQKVEGMVAEFLAFGINVDVHNPSIASSCKLINITPDCNIHLE